MAYHDAAPADGDENLRPLDEAIIALMRESVLASPNPIETAIAIGAGAVGHLRGTVGDRNAVAVLLSFAAKAHAIGR